MAITRRKFLKDISLTSLILIAGCPSVRDAVENTSYRLDRGSKIPFVFMHGLTLDSRSMEPYAEVFRELGHTTLTIDFPYHGNSADFGPRTVLGFTQVAREVARYEKLEAPIFGGHSVGGTVAMNQALVYPNETSGVFMMASAHSWKYLLSKEEASERNSTDLITFFSITSEFLNLDLPVGRISVPKVLIQFKDDEFFRAATTADLHKQLDSSPPKSRFEYLNGTHETPLDEPERVIPALMKHYDYLIGTN